MPQPMFPYPIIAGPTASGKTALAIQVAKALGGEVVCADSMQVYDTVAIGTARPTPQEMAQVPHHLTGFVPLSKKYSVAQYLEDATGVFEELFSRQCTPVLCGGTGLYIQSFMENRQLFSEEPNEDYRRELIARAEKEGTAALMQELSVVDPESAAKLHENDLHRIMRALEVYHTTGMTIRQQDALSKEKPSPYTACLFVLNFRERQTLYDRINRRVTAMVDAGLLEEAKVILTSDPHATVTQAIGYKELLPYFLGESNLETALDALRQQTRRYAKRQLSWFRRMPMANMIYVDDYNSVEEMTRDVIEQYRVFCREGE
ncbi:MAG: tRNA (adenosine(37)-N6)-dimethylallyltransferase MiaA [Clostridia bacterium]|nr:tRNA (adenosine(37)-N6)-dimethylallyltransferase MiaA [Clostridia bacterium]